jgi:hypothetical protein
MHARGGATLAAAAAAAATSYAPLFHTSASLRDHLSGFFGLGRAADGFPLDRLVARSPTAKSLLLLADEVLALLRADTGGALRVVNTGVRIFERETAKGVGGAYRATQEGAPYLASHLTRQRVGCSAGLVSRLLDGRSQLAPDEWADADAGLAARLGACCVAGSLVLESEGLDGLPLRAAALHAPGGALIPMVKGQEKSNLRFRLGTEVSEEGAGEGKAAVWDQDRE